jgi:hypothetical protein
MSEPERPTKVRKTRKTDTVTKPDVSIEMAEPVSKKEDDEGARNRTRQLNVDEVPFEFLLPAQKEAVLQEAEIFERVSVEKLKKDAENAKKAKILLGFVIGAGLGLCTAYLVKKNLLTPAVEAAIDAVTENQ